MTIDTKSTHFYNLGDNSVYNVRVIEYPKSYQVKMYEFDDRVLLGKLLGSDDKERRERKKRLRKELEQNCGWRTVDFDFEDLDEVFDLQERQQKEMYGRMAASRAKRNLYYIARSNEWEWFVTLTLNKEKIERFDYDVLSKKVKKWFNNLKQRKAPDMYYLIVPEQHKDGAWHFHGLIGGSTGLTFVDSGKYTNDGAKIFNLDNWDFGFTECTRVVDTERVSSYICKYITKTMCLETEGRNRYWVSKNCKRAPMTDKWLSDSEFRAYKNSLYDVMSYKKRVDSEWCSVDYFEIPKEPQESEGWDAV